MKMLKFIILAIIIVMICSVLEYVFHILALAYLLLIISVIVGVKK